MSQTKTDQPTGYYVPEQSTRPIIMAIALFLTVFGLATVINDFSAARDDRIGQYILFLGLILFAGNMFLWFKTAIIENMQGLANTQLKQSYVLGMYWFIFSEVMFFFGFFLALAYIRNFAVPWLSGTEDLIGSQKLSTHELLWPSFQGTWPLMQTPQEAVGGPNEQYVMNTGTFVAPHRHMSFPGWSSLSHWLPLWNTIILLSSSVTVHIAHLQLKAEKRMPFISWLAVTVALGAAFLVLQYIEYQEAFNDYGMTLNSGVYGTTFFMLTGFHGFHVCMGAFILFVMLLRALRGHFSKNEHFGFEAASWYWHFVDVVWVCLFLFVYIL